MSENNSFFLLLSTRIEFNTEVIYNPIPNTSIFSFISLNESIVIKLESIDQRLFRVEQRLDKVEQRLDRVEQRLDSLEQRFDSLEQRVSNLESGQIAMEQRLTNLESGQLSMANRLTNMELTLENEVSRNICTIAEAHLDLSRKFDRALKVKEDDELVRVRLNVLENDVRKIKQRLEIA